MQHIMCIEQFNGNAQSLFDGIVNSQFATNMLQQLPKCNESCSIKCRHCQNTCNRNTCNEIKIYKIMIMIIIIIIITLFSEGNF